jgi:mRNA interferase HigB
MQIIGKIKLDDFKQKHADARGPLDAWRIAVEEVNWTDSHDIKRRHATASFLAENRVIFNIKGNSYRLVVKVKYSHGVVLIEDVQTHAEYSKSKLP